MIAKKYTYNPKPAIFVNNSDNSNEYFYNNCDYDIWKINTKILDNIWFIDKHMNKSRYLITFENIPVKAIELIHIGKY